MTSQLNNSELLINRLYRKQRNGLTEDAILREVRRTRVMLENSTTRHRFSMSIGEFRKKFHLVE